MLTDKHLEELRNERRADYLAEEQREREQLAEIDAANNKQGEQNEK